MENRVTQQSVWAGWQDAPLSNHGMNQAKALAVSLADIPFEAIHSSDLKRAHMTALAVHSAQCTPQPPLTTSPLLREQHFGIAEGKRWIVSADSEKSPAELYADGQFPMPVGRIEKFPEGESLDDLGRRASQAVEELIMPHAWKAAREGRRDVHVAIVSHGLCISEIIAMLMKKNAKGGQVKDYRGLLNTAWSRVTVDVQGAKEGETLEFPDNDPPPLVCTVTHINQHMHINNIKRQKGGIGSAAHDPNQKDIRAFFSGGGAGTVETPVEAMEHSASNVNDEVGL